MWGVTVRMLDDICVCSESSRIYICINYVHVSGTSHGGLFVCKDYLNMKVK